MRVSSFSFRRLILAGVVIANCLIFSSAHAQVNDNKSYCSKTGHIQVFLIDVTTQYDEIDKRIIERMLGQFFSSAEGGDRLVVRTIADSHTKSERLVERCVPYCPAVGFYAKLTQCSDGSIRADNDFVKQDILNALRTKLSKFDELKYSDIIRTVVDVSIEEARQGQEMSLHIYSDLIENSDYLSGVSFFYYSTEAKIAGLKKLKLLASLKSVDVEVVGIGRADTPGRRPLTVSELAKVTDFWNAYFRESGASKVRISPNPVAN
jgi:hypothetical protein